MFLRLLTATGANDLFRITPSVCSAMQETVAGTAENVHPVPAFTSQHPDSQSQHHALNMDHKPVKLSGSTNFSSSAGQAPSAAVSSANTQSTASATTLDPRSMPAPTAASNSSQRQPAAAAAADLVGGGRTHAMHAISNVPLATSSANVQQPAGVRDQDEEAAMNAHNAVDHCSHSLPPPLDRVGATALGVPPDGFSQPPAGPLGAPDPATYYGPQQVRTSPLICSCSASLFDNFDSFM
jgi:hypothetical protein